MVPATAEEMSALNFQATQEYSPLQLRAMEPTKMFVIHAFSLWPGSCILSTVVNCTDSRVRDLRSVSSFATYQQKDLRKNESLKQASASSYIEGG